MSFADLVRVVDRSVFTDLGGEAVIYRPKHGSPIFISVTGIFDQTYVRVTDNETNGVETVSPAVFVRLEDLPTDPEWDDPILTIRGIDYEVVQRKTDGQGGVVLVLGVVD